MSRTKRGEKSRTFTRVESHVNHEHGFSSGLMAAGLTGEILHLHVNRFDMLLQTTTARERSLTEVANFWRVPESRPRQLRTATAPANKQPKNQPARG